MRCAALRRLHSQVGPVQPLLLQRGPLQLGLAAGEERGADTELTAIGQVQVDLGIPVVAIATLAELIEYLEAQGRADDAARLKRHRAEFGPRV